MGEIIEASPWENITKVQANKKPNHIDPPSPKNIFHFLPIRPRLNKRKTINDNDIKRGISKKLLLKKRTTARALMAVIETKETNPSIPSNILKALQTPTTMKIVIGIPS